MESAAQDRLVSLGLRLEEFSEQFVRSSGHGGQNVNKVSTCVWLVHQPTGLSVKAMEHRTQSQNREAAWRRLLDKIVETRAAAARTRRMERELKRRQQRRPSARARARNTEAKRARGRIKALRGKPSSD